MACGVSQAQLWSWIDRDAPELQEHIAGCPECRALAEELQTQIRLLATPLSFSAPPLPEKVGSYVVKRMIGEGGQALVYEAEQENPQRRIALKVFRGGPFANQHQFRQFQRETQTLARLHHPSVVTIHEAGRTTDGQCFIAMELVDGRPLDRYVNEVELSLAERIQLCRRICAAVQHAHDHAVIHRDLKPANILIEGNGTPRILDFGLARFAQSSFTQAASKTRSGVIQGTPRYMSPEQMQGHSEAVDHRCDIYALGVILFEVLTGESPFVLEALNPESLRVVGRQNPKRAGQINPALRGDLEAILDKALEVDPNRRYSSVRALDDDLRRHLEGKSISVRHISTLHRWRRRLWKGRLAVTVGTVVVCLAATSTWHLVVFRNDREKTRQGLRRDHAQLMANPGDTGVQGEVLAISGQHPDLLESVLLRDEVAYFRFPFSPRAAISDLKTRLERKPDSWPCHVLLAEIDEAQGFTTEAVLERTCVPPLPDRADAWLLKSLAMLDLRRALDCTREALRCDSTYTPALEQQQALLDASGDWSGAVACARRLVVLGERPAKWIRYEAEAQSRLGHLPEALAAYDSLARVDHLTTLDYTRRAQVERRGHLYVRAYNDLCSAIYTADNPEAAAWDFFFRGTVQRIRGNPDEAVKDYVEHSRLMGRPTWGIIRAAIIRNEQGRYGEASSLLDTLLASHRTDPWLRQTALCIAGKNAYETGSSPVPPDSLVARAVDKKSVCEARYYAGEAWLASSELDRARNEFEQCVGTGIEVDPNSPLDPMSEYELATWRLRDPRFAHPRAPGAAP